MEEERRKQEEKDGSECPCIFCFICSHLSTTYFHILSRTQFTGLQSLNKPDEISAMQQACVLPLALSAKRIKQHPLKFPPAAQ